MNSNFLISIACLFVSASCNNTTSEKKGETNDSNILAASSCYLYTSGKDSIFMKLNTVGNKVTGALVYNFYEKDKSKGALTGTLNGDTLFANYTFQSEGIESVREVAFIKKEKGYIEGYGDMDDKSGTKFKNKNKIKFSVSSLLRQIECLE